MLSALLERILEKVSSAFFAVPKIYFPMILLAMVNIWDNLSRIFRDSAVPLSHFSSAIRIGVWRLALLAGLRLQWTVEIAIIYAVLPFEG